MSVTHELHWGPLGCTMLGKLLKIHEDLTCELSTLKYGRLGPSSQMELRVCVFPYTGRTHTVSY